MDIHNPYDLTALREFGVILAIATDRPVYRHAWRVTALSVATGETVLGDNQVWVINQLINAGISPIHEFDPQTKGTGTIAQAHGRDIVTLFHGQGWSTVLHSNSGKAMCHGEHEEVLKFIEDRNLYVLATGTFPLSDAQQSRLNEWRLEHDKPLPGTASVLYPFRQKG